MKLKLIITSAVLALAIGGTAFSLLNRFPVTEDGSRLPKVSAQSDGLYEVEIPDEPKPQKSYQEVLRSAGPNAERAEAGDLVTIHFQVVSWETGETREATRKLTTNPIKVEAGLNNMELLSGRVAKSNVIVPQFLSDALVGMAAGDQKLVIFPENTADLPNHLPREDAYALVVDVVELL